MTGAKLVVAKMDRLARNVAFLSALLEEGVEFVACDLPSASRLTVHILAAVAEEEARAISARTKASLAAIKARIEADGFHLSKAGRCITRLGAVAPKAVCADPVAARAARTAKAETHAARVAPMIAGMRAGGSSYRAIASALNDAKVKAPRGSAWSDVAVKRIAARVEAPAPVALAA
jgi:DNA invertase Pin-like site-specific DNA recombinase